MRNDTTHFATRFVRWGQRYEYDWDYLVFPITGISGDYLRGEKFPPSDCVHTVDVDGVPIALILKRSTKDDLTAIRLLEQGETDSAVTIMKQVLEVCPDNITALNNLANIALRSGRHDEAIDYCKKMLLSDPTNPQASQIMIYALMESGKEQEAMQHIEKLKADGGMAFPYSMAARIRAKNGDINGATKELNAMLDNGLMDDDGMQLFVQIRMSQGLDQNAAVYTFYTSYANGLEKNGDKKGAENIRRQLRGY
jgi:tetratricopeptide (TPR) repeat protein